MASTCFGCRYLNIFTPRPDEKFGTGCRYPYYEGYVDPTKPECGGKRYMLVSCGALVNKKEES